MQPLILFSHTIHSQALSRTSTKSIRSKAGLTNTVGIPHPYQATGFWLTLATLLKPVA